MDQKRGKLFAKLIRMIEVASRDGGANPSANPTLADAISRARDASMPSDTIERAVKRGSGQLEGVSYESLRYEGFGPSGVAILVDVLTDNRNRTAQDLRRIFSRGGGQLGEKGSVGWIFSRRALIIVASDGTSEEDLLELAADAGADDVSAADDSFEIATSPESVNAVRAAIEAKGITIRSSEVIMHPSQTVPLDEDVAKLVIQLLEDLEDNDDVSAVHSNFEIADEVLARLT